MPRPESDFPTIRDLRDCLSKLIDKGLGDFPIQILIAPDSTLQAIAMTMEAPGLDGRPAMMIEMGADGDRLPVCIISADRAAGTVSGAVTRQ